MSILVKFFAGVIALFVAHRIISAILVIAFCFFLYKFLVDPKSFYSILNSIKGLFENFGKGSEENAALVKSNFELFVK